MIDFDQLMMVGRRSDDSAQFDGRVWYAAYGSNLCARRLDCYLSGGAATESHQPNPGCRDSSEPLANRLVVAEHGLVFSKSSPAWGGGGVAFLDPEPESGLTLVRLWNISWEQFCDIAAQENGMIPGQVKLDFSGFAATGGSKIENGCWYAQGLYLGQFEGMPVCTFTTDQIDQWSHPAEPYIEVIAEGLHEMGLSSDQIAQYQLAWSL